MAQEGYRPAADAGSADLLVRVGYGIDTGRERVRSTGLGYGAGGFAGGGGFGYGGGYGGFGRSRFAYGFYDPWAFGSGFNDVYSYTVFTSELQMKIDDRRTGGNVFDGRAEALSRTRQLDRVVPNLVAAMFTGFPGRSGETVRITVDPRIQDR